MSVEYLNFKNKQNSMSVLKLVDGIIFRVYSNEEGIQTQLDRSQAHLLMLYLQEHLRK